MRKFGGKVISGMMQSKKIKTASLGHNRMKGGLTPSRALGKMRKMSSHPSNKQFSISDVLIFRKTGKKI